MSTSELSAYIEKSNDKKDGWQFGNAWWIMLLFVPLNMAQSSWATQYHSTETYLGMPMNLVWLWCAITNVVLAIADLAFSNMQKDRLLRATGELMLRIQNDSKVQ